MSDVSTTCAVVIFRVKVSCITSLSLAVDSYIEISTRTDWLLCFSVCRNSSLLLLLLWVTYCCHFCAANLIQEEKIVENVIQEKAMLIGWVFSGEAPREIPVWILRFSNEKIRSFFWVISLDDCARYGKRKKIKKKRLLNLYWFQLSLLFKTVNQY